MFEIKGQVSTALCYAETIEEEAVTQIQKMCDQEFTRGSRIRIMPDVHFGKGCTIGTTMTVTDKAVPNVVGMDIGCGMYTVCLGKQVAEYYQTLAVDLHRGKEEYFKKKDALIAQYKAEGKRDELEGAIKALRWTRKELTIPEELCYLYGSYFEDYLCDVEICQEFAKRNRELIAEILLNQAGLKGGGAFHTVHNYIDIKERILRKGAVSARKGERLLIPINMRDGSILAVGKGNTDWNNSAPHGAGRVMSRFAAKRTLSMEEYRRSMDGIYTTSVNEHTLDEAPMVYKSLKEIQGIVRETVDIMDVMKPVYNFKYHGWQREEEA